MMATVLLTVNIVVWCGLLVYLLGLIPILRRRRSFPVGLVLVAGAVILSVGSNQFVARRQVRQRVATYYQAGLDEIARGNLDEARRQLEETLTLDPGHPQARRKLEEIRRGQQAEHREQRREARVDLQAAPVGAAAPGGMAAPSGVPAANSPAGTVPPPNAPAANRPPSPPLGKPGKRPAPLPHKPSPFAITHYALDVELDPPAHSLSATATVRVKSRGARLDTLDFSLHPECRVSQVTVQAAAAGSLPVPFRHTQDLLAVTPAAGLDPGRTMVVSIRYARRGAEVWKESGDQIAPAGTFLRAETRWYPATGELDFRAPVRVRVRVPSGYSVVSHGSLREARTEGKTTLYHWETDLPSAMVCVAARKYFRATVTLPPAAGRSSPLPISCYAYPEHRALAALYAREAAAVVRYYETRFGPYPFEKLAVAEIPQFPGGYGPTSFVMLWDRIFTLPALPAAAKQRSSTGKPTGGGGGTRRLAELSQEVLAHEIAHQWWGNSVAPRGMGAGWVSEAFANYSAWLYRAASAGNSRVLQKRVARATREYFAGIAEKGDQPISETDPYLPIGACQQIVYEKGAVVLHMLRAELGDASFFRVLRAFADGHRYGEAKIEDFRKEVNEGGNGSFDWFFDQWLNREGGMRLSYSFETGPGEDGKPEVSLTLTQPEPPYRAKLRVRFEAGDTIRTEQLRLSDIRQTFRFPVRSPVSTTELDPDGTVLMAPPRWVVPENPAAK